MTGKLHARKRCLTLYSRVLVSILGICTISCGFTNKQSSPEVVYSSSASEHRRLQVPPDLTDLSDGEQFVLPGNSAGALRRNTLLPSFQSVNFIRDGGSTWLEVSAQPEAIWPELLAFLRNEQLTVKRTEPINGLMQTEWTPIVSSGGLVALKNLLSSSNDMHYQRVALRLERGQDKSRIFLRVQRANRTIAESIGANELPWPGVSGGQSLSISQSEDKLLQENNAELASEFLQRLLIHFGLSEQKSKGLLDEDGAAFILDPAVVTQTAGGTQLFMYTGFSHSFRHVLNALSSLGMDIKSHDKGIGVIDVVDLRKNDQPAYTLKLEPVHVSEVKVTVVDSVGAAVGPARSMELLESLRQFLINV